MTENARGEFHCKSSNVMLIVVVKRLHSNEYLSAHVKPQLIFLRNSVAAYENGCVKEAILTGVVIRVLCHGTYHCESLLYKMGQKATLRLVTTANIVPIDIISMINFGELMAGITFGRILEYNLVSVN